MQKMLGLKSVNDKLFVLKFRQRPHSNMMALYPEVIKALDLTSKVKNSNTQANVRFHKALL